MAAPHATLSVVRHSSASSEAQGEGLVPQLALAAAAKNGYMQQREKSHSNAPPLLPPALHTAALRQTKTTTQRDSRNSSPKRSNTELNLAQKEAIRN